MWDTLQDKTRGFVVEAVLAEFDERNRLTEPIYKILQQDKAKGLVAEAILAELERDHGRFHGPIQKIFEGARQTEVGTLSAGEFVLTPTNRAYTVYVYYPEGYKGKLYYSLEGVSSPKSSIDLSTEWRTRSYQEIGIVYRSCKSHRASTRSFRKPRH